MLSLTIVLVFAIQVVQLAHLKVQCYHIITIALFWEHVHTIRMCTLMRQMLFYLIYLYPMYQKDNYFMLFSLQEDQQFITQVMFKKSKMTLHQSSQQFLLVYQDYFQGFMMLLVKNLDSFKVGQNQLQIMLLTRN